MAGTLWIPGAERLTPSAAGGAITSTAPPRAVWHTTEADPGTSQVWQAMVRVLTNKSAEPQVLYDPVTDRLGQFFALNLSGRALKNDGSTRTNRVGRVCIQIEVIARSAKPFTAYWKPGPNFRALMAALRSHGIVETWPAGPPPKFIDSPPHNVPESPRSRTIWLAKGGHYSHSQIPANDHGDPGGISTTALFAAGKPTSSGGSTPKENDVQLTDRVGPDRSDPKGGDLTLGEAANRGGYAYWNTMEGGPLFELVQAQQAEIAKLKAAVAELQKG